LLVWQHLQVRQARYDQPAKQNDKRPRIDKTNRKVVCNGDEQGRNITQRKGLTSKKNKYRRKELFKNEGPAVVVYMCAPPI